MPLTERTRKDMLPLVDRPLLAYTFEHLRRHGVRAGHRLVRLPADADRATTSAPPTASSRSSYEVEDEPLGTGGAIGFAARKLGETFFALNGDSLREADLDALARVPPLDRGEGDDPAHAGLRPEPLRPRSARRRRHGSRRSPSKLRPEETTPT